MGVPGDGDDRLMAACGDKYRNLLRTSDGRSADDPCWAFCGAGDYDRWRDAVLKIANEVWRRWEYVLQTEQQIEAMPIKDRPVEAPYPERAQLLFLVEDFGRQLESIPHPLIEGLKAEVTWSPSVHRAIAVGEKGLCVMEELDKAAAYYDAKPLPGPHVPPLAGMGVLGGLVAVAILGGGLYFVFRGRALP